jgi:hypothetical protein
MKKLFGRRLAVGFGALAMLACGYVGWVAAQEIELPPTYGSVQLKSGFAEDPRTVKLTAGGPIKTNKGGVLAHIAKAPDFKLFYEAGQFPLTIHVESKADTTLLINLPDGTWVANDDQDEGNLNPLLRFAKPQSGRYDIYVGTVSPEAAPATLFITELK